MQPLVYIVLLNYNNYKDTIECLKSLEKITYTNYKIVIVDNHSTDSSEIILAEMFPQHHIIQSGKNIGFSGGNNIGIQHALENGSDYILLLNNDTIVDENFLDSMQMSFNRYTDVGVVGCKIMHYPDKDIIWYAGGGIDWFKFSCKIDGEGRNDGGQFDEEKEVGFVTGCAMLIKREVFEEVGLLPEEYFMYFEDVDFCTRVLEHHYKIIYNPNAVIYHKVSRSSGGKISPFAVKWNTRNWIIFMNKHRYKTSNLMFLCSNLYFYSTRMIRYVEFIIKKDKEKADALLQGIKEGRKFVKQKNEKVQPKNFVTLFLGTQNFHLIKDVGMIPYIMDKHFGYQSKIVCYKNGEYPYLNKEVKGLKVDFIKKYTESLGLGGVIYLLKNSKKIDILQLFHFARRSLVCILVFKILNKKGRVYLKLDTDESIKLVKYDSKRHFFSIQNIKFKIHMQLLKRCNLISVETKGLHDFLTTKWPVPVEYLPNGFYDYGNKRNIKYEDKENIICTVGRIGTEQKATDVLLEGFKIASEQIKDWKLKIIGSVEKEFEEYMDEFFNKNPELKEKIIFTGPIYDREQLDKEYAKAKIFCLPSRWESFGLVFVEAMKNGCFIISSDILPSRDITDDKKYGDIFPINDTQQLAQCFIKICNDEIQLQKVCNEIQDFAYKQFYWVDICGKIDTLIKK